MVTPTAGHFDVLVIGTGPGGEGAAMQAVKHGKSVAVVERARTHRRRLQPIARHDP